MRRIAELDGLRAIAILAVLVAHGSAKRLPGGFLGVDLFFVLSGFLITSLLMGEERRFGTISFKGFYIRRALRILPPLFIAVALAIVLPPHVRPEAVFGAIFFYANFVGLSIMGTLGHTWSLSVEEHFYIVWPFLFIALKRWRIYVLIAAIVTSPVMRTYAGPEWHEPYLRTYMRMDELAIGCLAAALADRWTLSNKIIATTSLLAICGCFAIPIAKWLGFSLTAFAVLCAVGILSIIHAPRNAIICRFLRHPAMQYVGQRSYGIYLYHFPIYIALGPLDLPSNALFAIKLGATLTIAEASYQTVERWARQRRLHSVAQGETTESRRT